MLKIAFVFVLAIASHKAFGIPPAYQQPQPAIHQDTITCTVRHP
jgi:hypothetical protein